MKIKKGDTVKVLAGKDKGKQGVVLETLKETMKVVVEGVNMRTHHVKAKRDGEKGQRLVKPAAFSVSNVAALDPKSGDVTRVGYKVENGKKVRIARKSGQTLK
jgi:large subunit ribosomal protein L24